MQAYTRFAEVYDTFMDNVPYEEWASYLISLLKEYSIEDGVVLELGCGTGNLTRVLAESGYDMIGIDNSYEMLEIARDREYDDNYYEESEEEYEEESDDKSEELFEELFEEEGNSSKILYLEQDMRDFELFGTVRGIVSICDSMNYITSEEDLLKVFTLANNYLDKGGMFIFDMNTEYKYKNILADNTIAENRDDCSFIWENYYDEKTQLNEYNVTIYVSATDEDENLFERFVETHYQKAYSIEIVKQLLVKAGLEFIAVYDAFTHNEPNETSERVYFIAKEKEQKGKKYLD